MIRWLRHCVLALIAGALLAALPAAAQRPQSLPVSDLMIETATAKHKFRVELARTPDQRSIGLMHRASMPADAGMLFDFETDQPVSMWMMNTLIPLDMLFIARDGRIVNIASTAAKVGYPYTAAYVASKHGVLGLTRAVALEAQRYGVTVNAICPGWIDTDMTRASIGRIADRTGRSLDEARETIAGMNSSGRLIDPAAVAELCAHLLSPAAAATNGEALDIT